MKFTNSRVFLYAAAIRKEHSNEYDSPFLFSIWSQFKVNDVLLKEKFVFIQGMDQIGYDVVNSNHTNDIIKNMKMCLENDELVGFNTLGFIKNNIIELELSNYFKQTDGIYIKKSIYICKRKVINFC